MEARCMVSDLTLCDFGIDVENAYNHPPFTFLIISPRSYLPVLFNIFYKDSLMRTQKRALIRVIFLMLGFTAVLHWGEAASVEDKLVIISPHWEGIQTEFTRAFREWYENRVGKQISLDWIDSGGTSSDFRFIESEFQRVPEGIGLDLFFGGGTDYYLKLADRGLLLPYKLPAEQLQRIPQELFGIPVYDSEYRWYGTALSRRTAPTPRLARSQDMERFNTPRIDGPCGGGRPTRKRKRTHDIRNHPAGLRLGKRVCIDNTIGRQCQKVPRCFK